MRKNGLTNLLFVISLLLILLAVFPLAAYAQKEKVYKFGTLFPMTGPAAWIGVEFLEGIDLAVDEINAKGGVEGLKLEVIKEDHKANPKDGANAMAKLATLDKVPFVISSFTAITLAAQPYAVENKVLIINIGGTGSDLLKKPFLYNNQIIGAYGLPPLVDYFWAQGHRKLATIVTNDAFGLGTRKDFITRWEQIGGKVVADELFPEGATDFSVQLAKVKAAKPDCIATSLVGATGAALMKQMRDLGIKLPVADTPGDIAGMRKIGVAADNLFIAGLTVDPATTNTFAKEYMRIFRERYKKDPAWLWQQPNSYETVYILAELIKRVKKAGGNIYSGEQLLNALEKKPEFPTVYDTTLRFLPDHAVLKAMKVTKASYREGKLEFEIVKTISIEEMLKRAK